MDLISKRLLGRVVESGVKGKKSLREVSSDPNQQQQQ